MSKFFVARCNCILQLHLRLRFLRMLLMSKDATALLVVHELMSQLSWRAPFVRLYAISLGNCAVEVCRRRFYACSGAS